MKLREMTAKDIPAWDAFVLAHPQGSFFHRAGWARIAEAGFGHRPRYILAERDGAITGVLPLGHVKTRLFGNSLISVPYCVEGGPLAVDAATAQALAAHAAGLMAACGAPVTEFRFRTPPGWLDPAEWRAGAGIHATFRKPIGPDDEANMRAIPRKRRAVLRKAIAHGLTAVADSDVEWLHAVYAESVRNLGTPVFPLRYFRLLKQVFGEHAEVTTVLARGEPAASVMSFHFNDTVLPYYGGGRRMARDLGGNDFLYWAVMRRAARQGRTQFDFGRSKRGTGAFAFKQGWGFVPEPLHYRYRTAPGAAIPDRTPLNPKYRLFVAAWKRLPLPVAGLLGPHIVRGLG